MPGAGRWCSDEGRHTICLQACIRCHLASYHSLGVV
jgi:hypothetical protein